MKPDNAQVTSLQGFVANAPARLLQSGLKLHALRTNNLLRKDEWKQLDMRLVNIARGRLNGIADLRAAGLVHELGGLGVLMSEYEKVSDMSDASVDMDARARRELETVAFDMIGVPVPITHKGFQIDIRRLEASRRMGSALDTTQGEVAGRKVAEKLENMLFNGVSITVGGNSIYGYTTHPNRNTGNLTAAWTNTATRTPVDDVLRMIAALQADNMYGPYNLYVNGAYWAALLDDYKAESDRTILERIQAIEGIQSVKPADQLATGSVVLVQMSTDVVDLALAEDIQTVEWNAVSPFVTDFEVMGVMVPRVKADSAGQSGIAHYQP